MLSSKISNYISLSLCAIEFIFTLLYILNIDKTRKNDKEDFISSISHNFEKNKNICVSYYYYLSEFTRVFRNERDSFFLASTYFAIPNLFIIFIANISICSSYYKFSLSAFIISGIIAFCGFLDALTYPSNVDLTGNEIYIFEDSFNDKIKELLSEKKNIKIIISIITGFIFISIIGHIILSLLLFIGNSKKGNESLLSEIIKGNNGKDPLLK